MRVDGPWMLPVRKRKPAERSRCQTELDKTDERNRHGEERKSRGGEMQELHTQHVAAHDPMGRNRLADFGQQHRARANTHTQRQ